MEVFYPLKKLKNKFYVLKQNESFKKELIENYDHCMIEVTRITKKGTILKGFELHHIIPLHKGGTNDINNLIYIPKAIHALMIKKEYQWPSRKEVLEFCNKYTHNEKTMTREQFNSYINENMFNQKEYDRQWKIKNEERIKKRLKEYHFENKEKRNKQSIDNYYKNKEHYLIKNKEWKLNNKERVKYNNRKWKKNNEERKWAINSYNSPLNLYKNSKKPKTRLNNIMKHRKSVVKFNLKFNTYVDFKI